MPIWNEVELTDLPKIAAEIAAAINPGEVILVDAEMGSGKTTFAKALVAALGGNANEVSSPTFSIIQSYSLPKSVDFHHVDLYRLDGPEALYDIGMETLQGSNSMLYIEWPEYYRSIFEEDCHSLKILKKGTKRTYLFNEDKN